MRHHAFAFFLSMNALRAVEYLVHGTYTAEIMEMMVFSAPFLAITLWSSNQLHLHISERTFRRVVSWMILFGGLTLFYR